MLLKKHFISACKWLIFLAACTFGLLECGALIWLLWTGRGLPCSSSVCQILEADPLAKPLGIPLPTVGFAYYAALLATTCVWWSAGTRRAYFVAGALASLGAVISLILTAYVWKKYQTLCPWCAASTIASLVAFASFWALEDRDRVAPTALYKVTTFGLSFGIAASVLIGMLSKMAAVHLDLVEARALPLAKLAPVTRSLSDEAHLSCLAFVDLGCGSCRRTLRDLLPRRDLAVRIRFVKPMSDYGREAALLFLEARSADERRILMSKILEDESRTTSSFAAVRERLGLAPRVTLQALDALREDEDLSRRLAVTSAPVLLRISPGPIEVVASHDLTSS